MNYADDFCVLGQAPAAEMLAVVNRLMDRLKLPVNARKTRCLRGPEEPLEFLGYRIGWNYCPTDGSRYIGTRPSKASVQSICRRISEQTARRYGYWSAEEVVARLNRMICGWANYFDLGQVSPARMGAGLSTKRKHGPDAPDLPGTAPPPDSTNGNCGCHISHPPHVPAVPHPSRIR